ncbi:hypothetical protein [Haloarcula salinisoli]|uniref:PKD domain-containing protein n=1 Tax=Haloarcula salinisoli TaxID=2487746 RepID=A0A8J8C7F1_9EURY|nr:hypothetical protein [Halomicroarcula salinisoli]MBX0303281.1 hypothetical protein [Halomicroarcula salinisoli]
MIQSRRTFLGIVSGVVALLPGCNGTGRETTEGEAGSTETAATATPPESESTATIQYDGGPVTLDEYGEASVELTYETSGGTVADADFSIIAQPSGSGAGILEYDDYAEVQFDTRGTYTVQLTVTFADGTRARDTVDISVE